MKIQGVVLLFLSHYIYEISFPLLTIKQINYVKI